MAIEEPIHNTSHLHASDHSLVPETSEVIDGFRLTNGESVVEKLEVDGTDRFILTDMRVIYIGGDEDHRNWSFASLSNVSSIEVTRVSRERSSLYWGVLGLIASLGIWQVATNEKVGIVGGIIMALLGALLLWDYYFRTPPSRLVFHAAGQDVGGPLSRSAEAGARAFSDRVFELSSKGSGIESNLPSEKTSTVTPRYRYPAP